MLEAIRTATAADVWQRDRGVVPGNLSTSICRHILTMYTTWAHTAAPLSGDMEKKEVLGQNT